REHPGSGTIAAAETAPRRRCIPACCASPELAGRDGPPSSAARRGGATSGPGRAPATSLARLDDLVDEAVVDGLLRAHEEVAVAVAADPLLILSGVPREDRRQRLLHPQDLLGLDRDVGRGALHATPGLVD